MKVSAVEQELLALTKVKGKAKGKRPDYLSMVLNALTVLVNVRDEDDEKNGKGPADTEEVKKEKDRIFSQLSEAAQGWYNDCCKAEERGKPLPDFPKDATSEDNTAAETSEGEETEGSEEGTEGNESEHNEDNMKTKAKTKKTTAKKTAAPKTPKTPKAASSSRGLKGDLKITVVAKENPKRKGSDAAKRFAKYKNGMTVQEARDAGVGPGDLKWDIEKGFISVK